jgi:hypothetical protein
MQTDDLIRALAADRRPRMPVGRGMAIALAAGLVVSAIGLFAVLGPRPDIADAAQTPRFLMKFVETLLLVAAAAFLTLRAARPGAGVPLYALAVPVGVLAAAVIAELILVAPGQWETKLVGSNSRVCLAAIPLLSLPLLAAALFALKRGAPANTALAGAVAGLLASGIGATLYAMHCPDDSPLFVATWYPIATAAVTGIGALAGSRLLRW